MKKITTILMLLMLSMGAWAQNITTATYGNGNGTFYNSSGAVQTGGFSATKFVSNTTPAVTIQSDGTDTESFNAGDAATAARLGIIAGPTTYTISVPDGFEVVEYQFEAKARNTSHPAKTFTPEGGEEITIPADATWRTYKAENVNAQSTYFILTSTAWSPIDTRNFTITVKKVKFNLIYKCYMEGDTEPFETVTSTEVYADGEVTITEDMLPGFIGKAVRTFPASVTVNGADTEVDVYYTAASNFDYTVAINPGNPLGTVMTTTSIPAGTVVKINNAEVADGDVVSYSAAVTETDVEVTFPTGFEYMAASVDINGADIIVTCYDPRWSINFSKDQKYTRTNRFINNVRIGNKTFAITNDGLNTPAYRDFTNEVLVVPAGATLVPAIGYTGAWMHGFFYVDLDNDGTFYVQYPNTETGANTEPNGELLSYKNSGDALNSSNQTLPAFTMPTTPGDYRARFKMDWASTDPGGNTGDAPHTISSGNHIIANGGTIVDITLRILAAADVTYIVVDGNNNELFRTTETVGIGETITTLPEAYQHSLFYDYNTVNETISGNTTLTFTATPKADAPFQFTADTSAPVWYYLKNQGNNSNPNGAYPTYVAGGNPNVTLPTANAEDATTSWAFIGNPYSGFQIVNKAAGTSLVLGSASTVNASNTGGNTYATLGTGQDRETWTIEASSYATNGFFIRNADGHALNLRSNANLAYWTNGADQGSTFVATTPEEAYAALITRLQNIPFGTGLGQYSLTYQGTDYTERAAEAISDLVANGYTEQTMVAAQQMLAGASLNMPEPGFYRIKGEASQKYLTASMAENGKFAMTDATDNTTLFCFTAANGSEDAKLVNYPTGKAASVSGWTWIETGIANANKVEFQDGLTNGGYAIKFAAVHLYDKGNEGSADRGGGLTINSSTDPGYTCWKLEKVTELPITLKAFDGKYYATFYSPVAISDIAGECVAYGITITGDYAVPSKLSSSGVPANCGVLLIGDSESVMASVGTYGGTETTTGLKGVVASEPAADQTGRFYLGTSGGNLGFFKVKTGGATGGFKAFVEKATGSLAKDGFDLFFGDVTGVEAIENGALGNGEMYNLQGQRVNKAQKGVYIQNGKKMVVR